MEGIFKYLFKNVLLKFAKPRRPPSRCQRLLAFITFLGKAEPSYVSPLFIEFLVEISNLHQKWNNSLCEVYSSKKLEFSESDLELGS